MTEAQGADVLPLFGAEDLAVAARPGEDGRAERLLKRALLAAAAEGTVRETDLGLIGSALNGARALDTAERWPGKGGGPYATAALLSPYRETLQALGIPLAVAPGDPTPPAVGDGQQQGTDWLSDEFGRAE